MYRRLIVDLISGLRSAENSGAAHDERHGTLLADLLCPAHAGQRPLTPIRSVRIARQIAWALLLLHTKGACHGLLDPAHVLIHEAGTVDEQVEILGGEAIGAQVREKRTAPASLAFVPPEHLHGDTTVDTLVDIWRFGAVIFVMLTGQAAFPAASRKERLEQIDAGRDLGPLPSTIEPQLASVPALDRLVARMLAPARARRPRSAGEVHAELAAIERSLVAGHHD